MDPITAIAAATTAYNAIKKGFEVGKEIESMTGDLSRWMTAINNVKKEHNKAKGRRFGSIEEEALETFAAKKKADQMENELRNFIMMNYGMNAWQELLRIQGEIRKRQAEEKRLAEEKTEEIIFISFVVGLLSIFLVLGFWFVSVLIQ